MAQRQQSLHLSRARWRKSTHSNGGEGACVEVAVILPGMVAVRDSKHPDGPKLTFAPTAWQSFVQSVKRNLVEP